MNRSSIAQLHTMSRINSIDFKGAEGSTLASAMYQKDIIFDLIHVVYMIMEAILLTSRYRDALSVSLSLLLATCSARHDLPSPHAGGHLKCRSCMIDG